MDPGTLGGLNPVEVLFEFEEPLTFVCRDLDGQSLLAHSLCDGPGASRYLIIPTDARILEELNAGRIDLLGALRQPRCWVADLGTTWSIQQLWLISFEDIPKDVLPKPGAMLTPDLEPLFRLRLVGSGVGPGKTSAADVRMAAQAAESGLRGLARITLDAKKQVGQVSRDIRRYSDLPYQYSRAASFEIAFGRPRDRLPRVDDEVFDEMGRLLEEGLKALRSEGDEKDPVEGLSPEQIVQLFEAIKALTPPMRGGVDRVEVGGELVERFTSSKTLTRVDRTRSVERIKAARKAPSEAPPFRISGVIEEADQGASSFTLRQLLSRDESLTAPSVEPRFIFEDHLYDAVMEAFISLERVVVVGERIDSIYKALDIQFDVPSSSEPLRPNDADSKQTLPQQGDVTEKRG